METSEQKLLKMIVEMRPIEFAGLAKLFGVSLIEQTDENMEPRPFADVLEDTLSYFSKLNRQKKREVLRLVKKSNNTHLGDEYAGNSKDTESSNNN